MSSHKESDENRDAVLDTLSSAELLDVLQTRADELLAELKSYEECLQSHGKGKEVEFRVFKRGIEAEAKSLKTVLSSKFSSAGDAHLTELEIEEKESHRVHALRSANLPFYEAVWGIARQRRGILALGKRVCYKTSASTPEGVGEQSSTDQGKKHDQQRSAIVDIICDDGLEWIKVSTVTEKRLLFEMAKEGWEGYDDASESKENSEEDDHLNKDTHPQLELVRLAGILQKASQQVRKRFKHPKVRLVLPKIREGLFDHVDHVIADIRSLGVTVLCGSSTGIDAVVQPFKHLSLGDDGSQDMSYLLPSPSISIPDLTPTLNIDCTILLALISDISHIRESGLPSYPPSGHYHKAITRQIATERDFPLLPCELYRALAGRHLVCTTHAAQRMREIVQTMGTDTEKQRASALLAEDDLVGASPDTLRHTMQRVSCHPVPETIQLPIQIIDPDTAASKNPDPTPVIPAADLHVIAQVPRKMDLSAVNRSVFLHGWTLGLTTLTSNRSVAAALCRCIDEILNDEEEDERERSSDVVAVGPVRAETDFVGPSIYVCGTARSLVGKEKQGW